MQRFTSHRPTEKRCSRAPLGFRLANRAAEIAIVVSALTAFGEAAVGAPSATAPSAGAIDPPAFLRAVVAGVASSRVVGTPEPPPPYRVEPALPGHPIPKLITFRFEPGSGSLIYVHQPPGAKNTRLMRYDFNTQRAETLLDVDEFIYGIAFHPQYEKNGHLYLGTNGPVSAANTAKRALVVRYTLPATGAPIDPASAFEIIQWSSSGHNGTALAFGSDGLFYITSGDGTGDSDTDLSGQGLDHLRSKVLRIDVDHPLPGKAYSVPGDNPFVQRAGVRPETWAYGLRNPWRSSWDPQLHRLWVGQNGQDRAEQVYLVEKGANYGWSVYEGSHPFYPNRARGPDPVSPPTLEHLHHEARSLTGGCTYTGTQLSQLQGAYVYGDYVTGKIWAARHDGHRVVWHQKIAESRLGLTDFVTSPGGELWIANYQTGDQGGLYRLVPNPPKLRAAFPQKLSETGLFDSVPGYATKETLLPYSVIVPEWADGAVSRRHVGLPEGGAGIAFASQRGWDLPEGSVVLQSFALGEPTSQDRPRRWIETRLLTRQEGEWTGVSYRWNAAQTDADLVPEKGGELDLEGKTWRFPSRAECGYCHSRAANFLLGLQTAQMNRSQDYGGGFSGNQLEVIAALGLFSKPGAAAQRSFVFAPPLPKQPKLADPWEESVDLEVRARSYLHAACSHCHVEAGGGNAQMDLRMSTAAARAKIFGEVPLHGTLGLGEDARLAVPGDPAKSVLPARVARSGEGRMPPLGSFSADPRAVRLLVEWIAAVKPAAVGTSETTK